MRRADITNIINLYGNLTYKQLQEILGLEGVESKTWGQAKLKLVKIA